MRNPEDWINNSKTKSLSTAKKTVFLDYSHKDLFYLDRLKVHLNRLTDRGIQLAKINFVKTTNKVNFKSFVVLL